MFAEQMVMRLNLLSSDNSCVNFQIKMVFPKFRMTLKGKIFEDSDEIKTTAMKCLTDVHFKTFLKMLQQWKYRYKKRITSKVAYFEGD